MRDTGIRLAALLALLSTVSPAMPAGLSIRVVDTAGEPLQHAVVTVAGDALDAQPVGVVRISQMGQQFAPRVTAVARGTTVRFPNRDITQHHVYSFSEPRPFEIELYSGDEAEPVLFDRTGIVALGCNIHDWMLGYVFVTDDPWYAVTDEAGIVSFDATAGPDAVVTFWHPAGGEPENLPLGTLQADGESILSVTIATAETDPLDFEIDPLQGLFSENAP